MKDEDKTKEQLLNELRKAQQRVAEFKALESEYKNTLKALSESEKRYRVLVETSMDMIFIVNLKGDFLFTNKVFKTHLGYSEEEIKEINGFELVHPEDLEGVKEKFLQLIEGRSTELEYRYRTKDGSYINILNYASPIFDTKGNVVSAFGIARNISTRKAAEEKALEESEERFRTLFEFAPDAYYLNDLEGNFIDGNKAAEELTGYAKDELIGKNFLKMKILPSDQIPKATALLTENASGKSTGPDELILYHKDGSQVPVEIRTLPVRIKDQTLVLGIARDITERKKAEEMLRESEERYRTLLELGEKVGEAVVMLQDTEKGIGMHTFVSDTWPRITGYSKKELYNMSMADLIHPKYRKSAVERYKRRMRGEIIPGLFEISIIRKDGSEVPIEITAARTTYKGRPAFADFIRDITERKRAEEQTRYQASLVENVSDAIISTDTNFIIKSWNRAAETIYGWQAKEVVGKPVVDVTQLEYPHDRMEDVVEQFFKNGYWKGEVIQKRKDVTPINIFASVSLIKDESGNPLAAVAINRDITERKRIEEELQRSQLLASLGKMTASIAHEVNNPLASILLFTELLGKSDIPPKTKRDIKIIRGEARRASKIVKDLLAYGRKLKPQLRRLDLHRIVKKVLDMRQYQQKVQDISVSINLVDGPLYVMGDPSQLMQVFVNLIMNAEEALKDREDGKIAIATEIDGKRVKVSVADNGTGIAEENLSQVFYPFFSTKRQGEGTGLGLSTCYGIVTAHNGLIHVENNEMGGATFTVELPLVETRRKRKATG